jgi:hypothetical protein
MHAPTSHATVTRYPATTAPRPRIPSPTLRAGQIWAGPQRQWEMVGRLPAAVPVSVRGPAPAVAARADLSSGPGPACREWSATPGSRCTAAGAAAAAALREHVPHARTHTTQPQPAAKPVAWCHPAPFSSPIATVCRRLCRWAQLAVRARRGGGVGGLVIGYHTCRPHCRTHRPRAARRERAACAGRALGTPRTTRLRPRPCPATQRTCAPWRAPRHPPRSPSAGS